MSKLRYLLSLLILILLCNSFYAQDVNELFFDEASISFNRTNLQDDNTEDRNGFGLGLYHSFFPKKTVNLIFGIEYNRTSQFKKIMYQGNYVYATDLTYKLNMVTFPVGVRLNVGKNVKVFFEAGAYADVMIKSTREGIKHTYFPDENNQIVHKTYPIDEKTDLSSVIGLYAGLGVRIPVSSFELILKSDYKYGLQDIYSNVNSIYNTYWRIGIGIRHD